MQARLLASRLLLPPMGRPLTKPRAAYGLHLASLREKAGLTQKALAERLGVHQSNIAFWERWEKPPRGDVLPKLAEVLGVSLDNLLAIPSKPNGKAVVKSGPQSKLEQLTNRLALLPRQKQKVVVEMLEGFLQKTGA